MRCFVSASAFTNTRVIRKLIADSGVEIVDLHSLAEAIPLQVALKRELRKVDFAVFVLDRSNENVSYEVGLCDGLGKPVLIITSYKSEHFDASYLAAHIVVRSDLKNTLTLRKSIEQFIEDVANKNFKWSVFPALDLLLWVGWIFFHKINDRKPICELPPFLPPELIFI